MKINKLFAAHTFLYTTYLSIKNLDECSLAQTVKVSCQKHTQTFSSSTCSRPSTAIATAIQVQPQKQPSSKQSAVVARLPYSEHTQIELKRLARPDFTGVTPTPYALHPHEQDAPLGSHMPPTHVLCCVGMRDHFPGAGASENLPLGRSRWS